MRGPEGRPAKREPSPEGLGINSEDDPSAVGAALTYSEAIAEASSRCKAAYLVIPTIVNTF